jgi:hypothetical protein
MPEALVYWSARASGIAYLVAVLLAVLRLRRGHGGAGIRAAWTTACALLVAHELLALVVFFDWSQAAAWRNIAAQTRDAIGIDFGGGLIVNYLAAVLWTADVAWWWCASASYAVRPRWISIVLWSFLGLMFFFGAVVFSEGIARFVAAGLFALAGLCLAACSSKRPVGCSAST